MFEASREMLLVKQNKWGCVFLCLPFLSSCLNFIYPFVSLTILMSVCLSVMLLPLWFVVWFYNAVLSVCFPTCASVYIFLTHITLYKGNTLFSSPQQPFTRTAFPIYGQTSPMAVEDQPRDIIGELTITISGNHHPTVYYGFKRV